MDKNPKAEPPAQPAEQDTHNRANKVLIDNRRKQ